MIHGVVAIYHGFGISVHKKCFKCVQLTSEKPLFVKLIFLKYGIERNSGESVQKYNAKWLFKTQYFYTKVKIQKHSRMSNIELKMILPSVRVHDDTRNACQPREFPRKCSRISWEIIKKFPGISRKKFQTYFLQVTRNSWEFLKNFSGISREFLMTFKISTNGSSEILEKFMENYQEIPKNFPLNWNNTNNSMINFWEILKNFPRNSQAFFCNVNYIQPQIMFCL